MEADLWRLYEMMLRSRLYEELVELLWHAGAISGEMHMGIGEEGIIAGLLDHLKEGDALALDHRGTAPMVMRGVSLRGLTAELLGREDGLCGGHGGHMHLFSQQHQIASSGIVGSSGPAAAGFALAAQLGGEDHIAVAFFGEGALNEGMLMESFNLAAVWNLPVLFVCKDDGWAIFTPTDTTTRTSPVERASGLGLPAVSVDGSDVTAVWRATAALLRIVRGGDGPAFLHATCVRPHAHFLGDPLQRTAGGRRLTGMAEVLRSFTRISGDSLRGRARSGTELTRLLRRCRVERDPTGRDPVQRARDLLLNQDPTRLSSLEADAAAYVQTHTADLLLQVQAGIRPS